MMLRQELKQLGLLARSLSTSSTSQAVPAVAPSGLFSFLNSGKAVTTPMDTPLEGVDHIVPASVPSSVPATESHTLPNGVRLASQDTMSPVATIGVFVQSGSINENPYTAGSTHLLEAMAFKGTNSRSHFATIRQAEAYGVHLSAAAGREQTVYFASTPRDNVAAAMEILCDSVLNPVFQDHVLADEKAKVGDHMNHMVGDPNFVASEGIVMAAYSGALARPLFYNGATSLSAQDLTDFHAAHYTPGNLVVAASGASADVVQSLASGYLGGLPASAPPSAPRSVYVGGDRCDHWAGGSHALIAFETSGWKDLNGSVMTTVVQYLMGGGQDFSSGGPGKGMHSRLYQGVLTKNNWISSCTAYANIFEETGLFGVSAQTADPSAGPQIVDIVCRQLELMTSSVTDAEVARAKKQCLTAVCMALEMPQVVCEDIGRQMMTFGSRVPLADFQKAIEAITASDVKEFMKKLLASKPSGVLLGDQTVMPKFDAVKQRFQ